MAVNRVQERVTVGGHHVPEEVIRRRYAAGLRNFFQMYAHLAFSWAFYPNSGGLKPARLVQRIAIVRRGRQSGLFFGSPAG